MSIVPTYLVLALLAALVFAISSMCFKRAFQEGCSPTRSLLQTNIATGLLFLPLFLLDKTPFDARHLGWPILAGLMFFVGQGANFAALRIGDVSLATPIMGCKVVLVALCGWAFFGFPLTALHWIAAGLTSVGVLVLGGGDIRPGQRTGLTIALAIGCCICFAVVDTVIQRGARDFGSFNFLTVIFTTLASVSAVLWPWLTPGQPKAPHAARRWLITAIALTALQGFLMTIAIGIWQDATGVNVVYSLRGVFGVALVGFAGHWFGNREHREIGRKTLWLRFTGAGLILLAVVLTFANSRLAPIH